MVVINQPPENFKMKLTDLNYDTEIDYLPTDDIISLQKEIQKLSDNDIQPAVDVFKKYYGLLVEPSLIRNIFLNNILLAYETITGGISDTCQRDILVHVFLKFINIDMHWVTFGDTEEYACKFHKELKEKCNSYGISMVNKSTLKSYVT